jgi:hypothetical protein
MIRLITVFAAGVLAVSAPVIARQSTRTPVGPPELHLAVDRPDLTGNVKFEPFLGRADAMLLRGNTHVVKAGLDFGDGTIAFDLAPMASGDFAAITFRRQSFTNHENIYLRLRRSGDFMALQYAPRVNGSSTWQIYPEFTTTVDWPHKRWTEVRLEIRGSRMDAFVGAGSSKPVFTVPRLRNGTANGEIGFWARVNDKPADWAAAISNLRVTKAASTALSPPANAPVQFVWNWQVTDPIPAEGNIRDVPSGIAKWQPARAEESGLININRLFPVQKGRSVIFAKHTFTADAERRVTAGIGYSDDVAVFVNGQLVYAGINGWDSRSPALASFVDTRWESVVLPFKAGDNEVVLAVADDQRFGWGFALRIDDAAGVKF